VAHGTVASCASTGIQWRDAKVHHRAPARNSATIY